MAVIAGFSYLFISFVVYCAAAEKNQTVVTEVNINSRGCKAAAGFKSVNIFWEPPDQKNSSSLTIYRVKYCTSGECESTTTGPYSLGCIVNTTSLQKELQCRITAKTLFPFQFYFIVEIQTSSGVFISNRKSCRLLTNTQCTRPQNLTVIATGKRTLSVSWEPAPFMGGQTLLLCYKIWYATAQDKTNESVELPSEGESKLSWTISDLYPYTEYTFFIQCSFADCYKGWGLFDGPVTGRTDEEAPAEAPEFRNWSISNISSDKRDVTVVWKLPPSNTWNGVPKRFSIDFWQVAEENGSSIPIPNSSRNLQIDDGFATEATLFGLSRFADYKTQISMCTTEGCGPRSVPLPFAGDKKPNKLTVTGDPSDDGSFIWIVLGIVAGLLVLFLLLLGVLAVWKQRKNKKHRRHQPPLRQRIQLEDPVYGNLEESSPSRYTYDEIHLHEPDEDLHDDLHNTNQESGLLCGDQGTTSSTRRHYHDEIQLHEPDKDLHDALRTNQENGELETL
ncbi:hypothetical protein ACROYT_G007401 [Oculina patagonica]